MAKPISDSDKIIRKLDDLRKEVKGIRLFLLTLATKIGLRRTRNIIMSAISEYVAAVEAAHEEISTGVDEIVASVGGIAADVAALKALIEKLENNPGPISPEDQALLTQALTAVTALATKTKAAATAAKELDAATETAPTPPPE